MPWIPAGAKPFNLSSLVIVLVLVIERPLIEHEHEHDYDYERDLTARYPPGSGV